VALWGDQLTHLLEERGLNNSDLARALAARSGRTFADERRNVQRWVKSDAGPRGQNRVWLAEALDLPGDHPLITDDIEAAILGLLSQLEGRVDALEKRVARLEGADDHPGREAVDE
jgi:uncharacterized membrane-anchored protein